MNKIKRLHGTIILDVRNEKVLVITPWIMVIVTNVSSMLAYKLNMNKTNYDYFKMDKSNNCLN